ncbi:MAG TPA: hypothetical protein VG056_11955, partial [Pirellulales bacterium]|nr:hypothetical protein [Pirellulales bacterium]
SSPPQKPPDALALRQRRCGPLRLIEIAMKRLIVSTILTVTALGAIVMAQQPAANAPPKPTPARRLA